jgi:DNA-binding response OmpR family regulator
MKNICFITKSNSFDQVIVSLRKKGIDTYKKNIDSDLSKYEVLIIDLGHPQDMAYPLLEEIQRDVHFSEKIVIVAISHKSQIAKLRSFALGCDGYISSSIKFENLYKKIQELENPEKYLVKKNYTDKNVQISIEGSVTHISENGCVINSKFSLSNELSKIDLKFRLLEDLKINKNIQFSIAKSNPIAKRSFTTQINFLNLQENDRQLIREMIHGWSVK